MTNKEDIYNLKEQEISLEDFSCENGWILDFGGGGEGTVGQLKGDRVIAIDRRESELLEAIESGSKALPIIMDGKELKFPSNTFQTATSFFAFMYVPEENILTIFKEFYRILAPGGKFIIWDANFSLPTGSDKKLIAFGLNIKLPSGKTIETGYGTRKTFQSMDQIKLLGQEAGFTTLESEEETVQFHIILQK
jgi:ubiquinone/menaquinone biosynthesis C-methylase UbiE